MSARDCIARITEAAGRELTDAEVEAVFTRLHKAALDIKAERKEPGQIKLGRALEKELKGKPGADEARTMLQMAAEKAAAELQAEADKAEFQAHLQLVRMGARMKDVGDMRAAGLAPLDAVRGTIFREYSGKTNVVRLEEKVAGLKAAYERELLPAWDALGNDFLGFFQDKQKVLDLLKELRGEDSGSPMAKKGAEVFHQVAERMRQQFNENGGSIGKLDDWGMPQHHSQQKVAMADGTATDPPAARKAWTDFILPLLDRGRYVDDLGTPWDDARMVEFLGHAWDSIATDGASKITPGEFKGLGGVANRHAEERQIHFKDAQSVIDYWDRFGEKTVVEILHGHIETMARDIAFVEHFGPNPSTTYRTLRDQAYKDAVEAQPARQPKLQGEVTKMDSQWNYVSGAVKPSFRPTLSKVADGLMSLNVAGKLGGAVWASVFGDKPMMEAVSHLNDLPWMQRWGTELRLLNPMRVEDRRLLQEQGLMLESIRSGLSRFYEGIGQSSFTGKLASGIMRISGMQAINDIRKGAFGANLMARIASEVNDGRTWAKLGDSNVRALRHYGISGHDWNVWSLAHQVELRPGVKGITPDSIASITDAQLKAAGAMGQADGPEVGDRIRRDAMVKFLGVINTESEFAIVNPGWKERATFYANAQRGTAMGEFQRSFMQFKSFPWTQMLRGLDAVSNQNDTLGKAGMVAWLLLSTTAAGAMIMQVREMLAGKDPRPMFPDKGYDKFKFWGAAFLQGGALGIYGDFLASANQTRYGTGPLEIMAGPTVGPLLSLGLVQPMNAAAKSLEGKDTHLAAQTMAQIKGFVPGNNLWYTKAATEHLVWMKAMEAMSPGYLGKIRERTMKEYQQDWWWRPGDNAPERAPDLEKAIH